MIKEGNFIVATNVSSYNISGFEEVVMLVTKELLDSEFMQLINDGTISIREATINEKAFCFDLIDKTKSKTAAPLLFLDRWLNGEITWNE